MREIKFTKRQLDIIKILKEQTFCEKSLHKIYQGAMMAMGYHDNPESLSQAAHSLRELNSIMVRHITLVTQVNDKEKHKEKIKTLLKELDELGGIKKDAIIKQWHDLNSYFLKICHHGIDNIDSQKFEQNLDILENIILAILGPVYDSIKELDILMEIENPSKEDIDKAISFIKNLSQYEYFFKHLKNPNWLELLDEIGFFANTPRFGERSIEPLFLLKVAKDKPEKILEIIKRHKETDHPGAQLNYIKCLIEMPMEYSIQMLKPIKKWINSLKEYSPPLYYTLINFLQKLIEENKDLELFDLISSVFAIKKDILDNDEKVEKILNERWKNVDINNYDVYEIYDDRFNLKLQEESQSYLYDDLIRKIFPSLMEKFPIKTLKLFLVKLRIAINFYLKNQDKSIAEDISLGWFRDLDEKPIEKNFRNVLVNLVREILLYIGENYKNRFPEAIAELRKSNYLIFRRLEYYCYNKFPELSGKFMNEIEFEIDVFSHIDKNPELYKLMETNFSQFPKKTQDTYLNYINEGAKEEEKYWKENHPEIPLEQVKKYVKNWQKKKAKAIIKFLDPTYLKKLEIEAQEVEDIKLFEKTGVIFGDESPITAAEIESMSVDDLLSFLINYDDKEGIGFSKIGLGRTLRNHINERPKELINLLERSLEYPKMHKYISFIIDGFSLALKEKKTFNIQPLLSIFKDLLKNKIKFSKDPIFLKENTSRDIKKSIADFIHDNLNIERIPLKYRKDIWNLILLLLQVDDLTQEKELINIERNWMPKEMCLNSVRGITSELVFKYTSWVLSSIPIEEKSDGNLLSKFVPEVIKGLDLLLDDTLYTTRYIFGMNFYYLCLLELDWVKNNLDNLFPENKDMQGHFEAIWAGFLDFNNVNLKGFKLLRPQYIKALNLMNKEILLIPFSIERLINHIMVLYINGIEVLEEETSLINIFLKNSNGNERKAALRSIGINLNHYSNEKNFEEIKIRLINLAEDRIRKAKAGKLEDYIEELQGFLFWFRNSIFDKKWMIQQFLEVLRLLNGSIHVFYDVLDILRDYVKEFPDEVYECLYLIIKSEIKSEFLIFEDKYKNLLGDLLENEDAEIRAKTVDIINYLIKLNFHSFSGLLREEEI